MEKPLQHWKTYLVALCLLLFSAGLQARPGASWQLADNGKSISETARHYRADKQSRVLAAEPKKQNGREVHRIRVLTDDGRVKTLLVDPETGREIRR